MLGLTQTEVALLLGQKKANYSQKENGNIDFKLCEMVSIQKEFNRRLKKLNMPELTMDEIFLI